MLNQRLRVRYPVQPHSCRRNSSWKIFSKAHSPPSADSRTVLVSYWPKYMHFVLINRLSMKMGGRLTDMLDRTLIGWLGRNISTQHKIIMLDRKFLCSVIKSFRHHVFPDPSKFSMLRKLVIVFGRCTVLLGSKSISVSRLFIMFVLQISLCSVKASWC